MASIFTVVPTPRVLLSPIQGAMVGSPLMIQCRVSTVSGVESSSIMIRWMGPGEDTITSNSRVTVNVSSTNILSTLNFMYLVEGDQGNNYTCNVMILETSGSASVTLISES